MLDRQNETKSWRIAWHVKGDKVCAPRASTQNRLVVHYASWPSREMPSGTWLFSFQHVLLTWPFAGCPLASQSQVALFFTFLHQFHTLTHYIESHKHTGKWLKKYNQIWHRNKANNNIIENHSFVETDSDFLVWGWDETCEHQGWALHGSIPYEGFVDAKMNVTM